MIDQEDAFLGDGVLGDVQHEDEQTIQKIVADDECVENGKFFESSTLGYIV